MFSRSPRDADDREIVGPYQTRFTNVLNIVFVVMTPLGLLAVGAVVVRLLA